MMPSERTALTVQGGYYVVTGVAPFVSRRAFEAVTGPKREWWLVQTVGAIVTTVGAALVSGAGSGRVTPELRLLAAGCAAGLAAIDIMYVARRRIAPTYLLDAAAQLAALAPPLATTLRRHSKGRPALDLSTGCRRSAARGRLPGVFASSCVRGDGVVWPGAAASRTLRRQ